MPSNDPKHGRWILPLIIAAMVLLTYTFVNSLEPTDTVETTPTTGDEPPFPTTPQSTVTTTTLPPELASFMVTVDAFETQLQGFAQQITDINDDWEARSIDFSDARDSFDNVRATVALWEQQVAEAAADAPAALAEPYVAMITEAEELAPAIEDIILGLEAPDTGELRREAVAIWEDQVQDVIDAMEAIKTAAAESAEGTTGSTDTSNPEGDEA